MFVQVIQGQVSDAGQMRAALDRWAQELAPGASGWLGSTAGVTDDGRFIALARFESEEAARRNSDRAEQDEWWAETSELFNRPATFRDSRYVVVDVNGEPDNAGSSRSSRAAAATPTARGSSWNRMPQSGPHSVPTSSAA